MTKIFNKEVNTWGGLYSEDSRQRYAIFQGNAKIRVARRMDYAVNMLDLKPDNRLLDVACGSGNFGVRLKNSGVQWTGVDIAFNMLAAGCKASGLDQQTAHWVNANANQLPFPDDYFDAVVCLGMINFYQPEKMPMLLREMARVLADNGKLLVTSLRLDVLTWIRSRLYPTVPLPFSSPGPLYPVHHKRMEAIGHEAGLQCTDILNAKKYFNLPHYSMLKFTKRHGF